MLSYRKSQQVSLTEKLKKKNVIHAFGVSGSGTTMARLYHSAFARVVTTPERQRFTIAHLCHSAFARVATEDMKRTAATYNFATAHSRGLRRSNLRASSSSFPLPQRIRAGYDAEGKIAIADYVNLATAHSRGLRLYLGAIQRH